jgi:hypothetical protein
MTNFKKLLLERNAQEHGCLMAGFPKEYETMIVEFGKKFIPDNILYTAEDDDYGREGEPHVTILYGFTEDLNEMDVRKILKNTKPFNIIITSLDKFETGKGYDVVVFKLQSDVLTSLHEKCKNNYSNIQTFLDYNPHITVGYVKPGTFSYKKTDLNIVVPVTYAVYSPIKGGKSYFDL